MTLRAPSAAAIARFLDAQRQQPFAYPEVGATRGELPTGYRVDHRTDVIGHGAAAFARARDALAAWRMHEGAGVRITPHEPPREGLTVALVVRAVGVYTTSACRVVYVVDEPRRAGFAYGTLGDHPVAGEERFTVEHAADDSVRCELLAFSRPSSVLWKLATPMTRRTQLALGAAYVAALQRELMSGPAPQE